VGDSEVDLMTARNSGLPCISVLWGFRERSFLDSNGATMYAKTPQELIDSFWGVMLLLKVSSINSHG
jgi:phosphoglycolate phosphatase